MEVMSEDEEVYRQAVGPVLWGFVGHLPTERHELDIILQGDMRTVVELVRSAIPAVRSAPHFDDSMVSGYPPLIWVTGSGFLRLNPAVVRLEIIPIDENRCTVRLSAAAKEGLVKQKTAERAISRVAQALRVASA